MPTDLDFKHIENNINFTSLGKELANYRAGVENYQNHAQALLANNKKSELELMRGVEAYQEKHVKHIQDFLNASKNNTELIDASLSEKDPQYFRKTFIRLISAIEEQKQDKQALTTVSLEKFLGKEGALLYRYALEEEMYSQAYREAVFNNSTTHYQGQKWKERPIVLVAGPSGCGKSVAANQALKNANQFLAKEEEDSSGNYVIASDGGIAREVSQIRKLVIKAANNKGYAGIKDLHNNSKILGKMKNYILNAGLQINTAGIVIPETFSAWKIPNHKIKKLMPRLNKIKNAKQIFCRVEGKQAENFQSVVKYMGQRRAWQTKAVTHDLTKINSNENMTESKGYGAGGFIYGVEGSKAAEKWYKKNIKPNLNMIITNDLILLKEDTEKPGHWLPAKQGDANIMLVSEHAYLVWEQLYHHSGAAEIIRQVSDNEMKIWQSLIEDKKNKHPELNDFRPSLQEFRQALPIQIKTSIEVKLNILAQTIHKKMSHLDKKIKKSKSSNESLNKLVRDLLDIESKLKNVNLSQTADIEVLLNQLNDFKEQFKKDQIVNPDTSKKISKILENSIDTLLFAKNNIHINQQATVKDISKQTINFISENNKKIIAEKIIANSSWQSQESSDRLTLANQHRTFNVSKEKISTLDYDLETYKTMLKTFIHLNPDRNIRITAKDEQAAAIIQSAIKEIGVQNPYQIIIKNAATADHTEKNNYNQKDKEGHSTPTFHK